MAKKKIFCWTRMLLLIVLKGWISVLQETQSNQQNGVVKAEGPLAKVKSMLRSKLLSAVLALMEFSTLMMTLVLLKAAAFHCKVLANMPMWTSTPSTPKLPREHFRRCTAHKHTRITILTLQGTHILLHRGNSVV